MREWNEFSQTLDGIEEVERQAIRETARIVSILIKRREELGMTQAALAAKAGLKQSAILKVRLRFHGWTRYRR
ncbi:helix-turn-helix domain-containing protein [Paenibacillus lemnae]|uniref:Helix-turn-helix domain-containing protein n=1 Tax=Paenibacillus lemnae TaxID=1330551 RepID=A0A848M7V0_PAELE|nr:helix-turn-helix domain-containing protein [Paenibacillus lemnae]NMO96725.1 helix-turn-helix domain-containing protein [Paenibacillus lemnae]